jgi:hypothetical protein
MPISTIPRSLLLVEGVVNAVTFEAFVFFFFFEIVLLLDSDRWTFEQLSSLTEKQKKKIK